jgi:uncharacterized protein (TIGR02172 family)
MKPGKVIGIGNTAVVYELECTMPGEEDKVLKLFNAGYPKGAIETEYRNAMAVRDLNFPKPKAYELADWEGRKGIIYDRIKGDSLLDWVMKTGDVEKCAHYMADLHKTMIYNLISDVPNYKDFLTYHIQNAAIPVEEQKKAIQSMEELPKGDTLCHGDFHPGNIIISEDSAFIIDFMNICQGNYLYDIARTVYLVEYTPVPTGTEDKAAVMGLKKTLADLYLEQMKVTREMIQDYITLITIARKGENPDEV